MKWNSMRFSTAALVLFAGCTLFIRPAQGVELIFPPAETEAGGVVEIPVMVDAVENLAGVKLSLTYDKQVLTFLRAKKTPATSSLMHIVNDKKPGVLIIVMAGARGIKGQEVALLRLLFKAKNPESLPHQTELTVKEIQLMSDQLTNLSVRIVSGAIRIQPPQKPLEYDPSSDDSSLKSQKKPGNNGNNRDSRHDNPGPPSTPKIPVPETGQDAASSVDSESSR